MTLTPTNDETSYHGNLMDALPVYGQPVLRGGSQLWLSDMRQKNRSDGRSTSWTLLQNPQRNVPSNSENYDRIFLDKKNIRTKEYLDRRTD